MTKDKALSKDSEKTKERWNNSENASSLGRPRLFISHRHVDEKLASAIRGWVQTWTLRSVDVFQSSYSGSPPLIGENLNQSLISTLHDSQAVLLVYTAGDQNWSYCMWECGVSMNNETRLIVLQCKRDVPSPFQDQVRVILDDYTSLKKFVIAFLTSEDFFPSFGPVAPHLPSECPEIERATDDLHARLKKSMPDYEWEDAEEWPALPYLRLELEHNRLFKENSKRPDVDPSLLEEFTVRQIDRYAAELFGVAYVPPEAKFSSLLEAWRDRVPGADEAWLDWMAMQCTDAAANMFPRLSWKMFNAAQGSVCAPLMQWRRLVPSRQCLQFEFLFLKFDTVLHGNDVLISNASKAIKR